MDKVFIKSLEVETIIGIWESEKKTKQKIIGIRPGEKPVSYTHLTLPTPPYV